MAHVGLANRARHEGVYSLALLSDGRTSAGHYLSILRVCNVKFCTSNDVITWTLTVRNPFLLSPTAICSGAHRCEA